MCIDELEEWRKSQVSQKPQGDLFDICQNRHRGNAQSQAANRRVAYKKASDRQRIYELARSCGAHGITTDEVSALLNVPPNSISGRISELKRDGLLVATERTRPTRANCSATVLVAKEKAVNQS